MTDVEPESDDVRDGLGRNSGEVLLDQALGSVQAEALREYADLCDALAERRSTPGQGRVRGRLARWWLAQAARLARDMAGDLDAHPGMSLAVVRNHAIGVIPVTNDGQ